MIVVLYLGAVVDEFSPGFEVVAALATSVSSVSAHLRDRYGILTLEQLRHQMSDAYGGRISGEDSQLDHVSFARWLLEPNTSGTLGKDSEPKSSTDRMESANEARAASVDTPGTDGTDAAASPTLAPTKNGVKPARIVSCVQCQTRKIKCSRTKPSCDHCIKSGLLPCEYRPPAPPRRGKRKPTEADLLTRLKICEDLLKRSGIEIDSDGNLRGGELANVTNGRADGPPPKKVHVVVDRNNIAELASSLDRHTGKIILEEGGRRYVESDLWRGIGLEINQAAINDAGQDDADTNNGDFLFDSRGSRASLESFHPSITDAGILWATFLENVEPLLKILHVPTFESEMWEAARNIESIPSPMEALMFAIYTITVASMSATECEKAFGVAKSVLYARFESAVKKAFVKAGALISTDFRLVQAIVIWLHSIRDLYHPNALWILSGVALRMSQRAGIHRENSLSNFTPFEAEIRRRTWWALMAVDSRAAELAGSGISVFHNAHDTQIPRNLNDKDLQPDMKELPKERVGGATDMVFVSLRFEVGRFFKDNLPRSQNEAGVMSFPYLTDAKIDAFEQTLEHKFLRFCDALYPLHYITSVVGRACVGMMRLIMHHPCQDPDGGKNKTAEEKEFLYQQAVKLVRYQHLINSTPALARYKWHVDAYQPWHALIYIITTICKRGDFRQAQEVWELVEKTFDIYPKMINDTRRPLHVALGNLVMKAWDATGDWFPYERVNRTPVMSPATPGNRYSTGPLPEFISKLRAQRAPKVMPQYPTQHLGTTSAMPMPSRPSQPTTPGLLSQNSAGYGNLNVPQQGAQYYASGNGMDVPNFDLVDLSPEAWAEWDKLLVGEQTVDYTAEFRSAGSWGSYGGLEGVLDTN